MMSSYPSPDGRFRLDIHPVPMRMSHEVDTMILIDQQLDETLFDPGSMWDAQRIEWDADSRQVRMTLRRYDNGARLLRGVLDAVQRQGEIWYEERLIFSGPFTELQQAMIEVRELNNRLKG